MRPLPHHYHVRIAAGSTWPAEVSAGGLPALSLAPPADFDGPGDRWSPEDLLMSAVASCFVFTFQAIASASRVQFSALECTAEGVLDHKDSGMAFCEIVLRVKLSAPTAADHGRLERLVQKAEQTCLVTRSLNTPVRTEIEIAPDS